MSHDDRDLPGVYTAIVDRHNSLVHMRFSVAGLYLAASGFLAGALFSGSDHYGTQLSVALPILGLASTLIAWLLEIRTYQLLEDLTEKGKALEKKLHLGDNQGFFELQSSLPARLPFTRVRFNPRSSRVKYFVSHSFGLNLLYLSFTVFWGIMLYSSFTIPPDPLRSHTNTYQLHKHHKRHY